MGLYFRRTPGIRGDLGASTTWREYVSALSAATDPGVSPRPDSPAPPHAAKAPDEREMGCLLERVRHRPEDETAHRLLGLGHLARGQTGSAVRHLEIALALIRQDAMRPVGLTDTARLQGETATLRLVLIRLYMRLENRDRAEALARESRAML
jgi:hypothetical protein